MTDNQAQDRATCPKCGAMFPAIARFCPVCGQVLSTAQAPSGPPPVAPAPTAPAPTAPITEPALPPAPGYGQPQGYGSTPGYPAPYGYAPARGRRNTVPILVGLGLIGLILVVAAGGFVVSGGFGSGASSSTASPLVSTTGTSAPSATAEVTAAPTTAVATAAPTGKYAYKDMVVGFIETGYTDSWDGANNSSFKDAAAANGVTVKASDAQGKIENQITAFNQFVADPTVNVIVLAAVQTTGYDDVLRAAKAAGKVVIIENLRIEADYSLYYTYVGPDFNAEGQKGAAAMCTLLKGMSGTKVFEIAGDSSSAAATDRGQGFRDKMSDCGITIAASQAAAGWDPATAKSIMAAYLNTNKNIQGVLVHNDAMAVTAIQAIDAAGLKAGRDIKVVSFDATADGFHALISGELGADVECSPDIAPQAYKAALDALNGVKSPGNWIPTNEGVFSASQGAAALQAILTNRKY